MCEWARLGVMGAVRFDWGRTCESSGVRGVRKYTYRGRDKGGHLDEVCYRR